jgi:peptidoglycan/xylan/chitin deacetylase (PgdA/CDA1 family)
MRLQRERQKHSCAFRFPTCGRKTVGGGHGKAPAVRVAVGLLFLVLLLFFSACGSGPQERIYGDFLMVEAQADENLSTLAAKYLADPTKDWVIAEFNGITSVIPGQALIIPLKPLNLGGLELNGYQTVPVLRYRRFSKESSTKTRVSQANFEAQMNYLKTNGYRVITLDQLMRFLDFQDPIPVKAVVITIDGGWPSTRDIALPILKKYGFRATLFIATDLIGQRDALTWQDIRYLDKNGIDIQCLTKSYRDLATLRKDETFKAYWQNLETELLQSKALIQRNLNKECKYLAYPYGAANKLVIALVRKYGFWAAFTLKNNSNPFFVNNYLVGRSTIYGNDGLNQFKNNLVVIKAWN